MSSLSPSLREPFAITHATVVIGDANGTTLHDTTVIVGGDGRIERIAPSIATPIPDGYRMLDATGKTVTPGLINAHVHLFSEGRPLNPKMATPRGQRITATIMHSPVGKPYLKARAKASVMTLLRSGVTTIRTLGDVGYEAVELRDRIADGHMVGPRILAAGPLLAIPEGHGAPLIALTGETPEDMARNTRENLAHGVNAIKIAATGGVTDAQRLGEAGSPQMTVDQMRAICDVAHEAGVIVAAHAQSPEGVKRALLAGVDTIEHGSALDDAMIELFRHNPHSLRGWSALIPTMSAGLPMTELGQDVTGITDIQLANARTVVAGMLAGAEDAHDAGLRVGVGTDTAMTFVTQYNTWRELDLLVKRAGFTAAEALHAATLGDAEILGVAGETGSVEAGKAADLLVLDANPLLDLRALKQPALVIADGRPLWHPQVKRFDDIDALLDRAYDE
ncbi:imidazolonepropionase [Bifidobacterium ramosum]|uniref:Amidohydrolase family protein n=1 Tax=Bifidobacterium ramosum TaxID=1798158 RepID=A0A6L4WZG9_9BIFI|nr:amidohydrolase family protein [Bifidobacterium ramosum]KAB8287578.1 imidazolonepropionase [Bifidobacterium ramosum]NEG72612.1 amidohydrolase family protein [Bifidobacterium ramosum]